MKKALLSTIVVLAILGTVCLAAAASPQDDARTMVGKAVTYWKAHGKDKTLTEINNPKGQFVKGDLYLFVQSFEGVILAHGNTKALVGKSLLELKDPNGKSFSKEMVDVAKTKGKGWVEYWWQNPATKKVHPKMTWVQRVEGEDAYIACGIYK